MKFIFLLFFSVFASAQVRMTGAGASISSVNSSAFIDASSNSTNNGTTNRGKGLVFPRVELSTFTFNGSAGIPSNFPTYFDGMIVYNTSTTGVAGAGSTEGTLTEGYWYYYNKTSTITGGTWKKLNIDYSGWSKAGNAGTNPTSNFIGTTDAQDIAFKTNNAESMRISSSGNIGIGTIDPKSKLDINGSVALPILSTSSNVTLDDTHSVVRVNASSADVTVTLPVASTATNRIYSIIKSDSSNNKIIFNGTITGNGFSFTEINIPGEYKIQSDGTNWYLVN